MTEFMARQRAREEQRQRNLERIKMYAETDQGHPQLNRRSIEMAARNNPTEFLARVQQNVEKMTQVCGREMIRFIQVGM